ncbi:MAG TPA: MmcQ/YjbR family DNA-binding protein [Gaiellaceae bacterium]|nr:MmcQ/YjbR family DNA-binding protein [Gaiellaceae bacterium]
MTWKDVVKIARELPEIEETTSYGRPALKVRGKFVAAMRTNPDALVVRCDLEEKPFLLEARPDILFETPHYHGWGYMLVKPEASLDDVREFLTDSWLLAAPKKLASSLELGSG